MENINPLQDVFNIIENLRDPINGKKWELSQDFSTLVSYTLEESYELQDAVRRGKPADIMNEVGDLLWHIVFYCKLAKESDLFTFDDVCISILDKQKIRNFSLSAGNRESSWQSAKRLEKGKDILNNIPKTMPALIMSRKIFNCLYSSTSPEGFANAIDLVKKNHTRLLSSDKKSFNSLLIAEMLHSISILSCELNIDPEKALLDFNEMLIRSN